MQQESPPAPPVYTRSTRPAIRGPVAVRAGLIAAAGELFAARGAAAVSVREIADRAGVNHGLIHHYFHSKQGLVEATLDELAAQASKSLAAGIDLSPHSPLTRYLVVAGRLLLDGEAAGLNDPLGRSGGLAEVLRQLAELSRSSSTNGQGPGGHEDGENRLRAVRLAALLIGLLLFEPALLEAAGLSGEDPAEVGARLLHASLD